MGASTWTQSSLAEGNIAFLNLPNVALASVTEFSYWSFNSPIFSCSHILRIFAKSNSFVSLTSICLGYFRWTYWRMKRDTSFFLLTFISADIHLGLKYNHSFIILLRMIFAC